MRHTKALLGGIALCSTLLLVSYFAPGEFD